MWHWIQACCITLYFFHQSIVAQLRLKYLVFSPHVPSKQEKYVLVLLSLYIFCGKCVSFQFLKNEIHNHAQKKHNCAFYHSKLKSKNTSLKKYTNWTKLIYFSLVLREWEKKKTNISHLRTRLDQITVALKSQLDESMTNLESKIDNNYDANVWIMSFWQGVEWRI